MTLVSLTKGQLLVNWDWSKPFLRGCPVSATAPPFDSADTFQTKWFMAPPTEKGRDPQNFCFTDSKLRKNYYFFEQKFNIQSKNYV